MFNLSPVFLWGIVGAVASSFLSRSRKRGKALKGAAIGAGLAVLGPRFGINLPTLPNLAALGTGAAGNQAARK